MFCWAVFCGARPLRSHAPRSLLSPIIILSFIYIYYHTTYQAEWLYDNMCLPAGCSAGRAGKQCITVTNQNQYSAHTSLVCGKKQERHSYCLLIMRHAMRWNDGIEYRTLTIFSTWLCRLCSVQYHNFISIWRLGLMLRACASSCFPASVIWLLSKLIFFNDVFTFRPSDK